MKHFLLALALGLAGVGGCDAAAGPGRDDYHRMLLARDFDALDRAAARARRLPAPARYDALERIYHGTSGCGTRACAESLTPAQWDARKAALDAWRAAAPESATAEVAQARYFLERGWAVRGAGTVDTVPEDAWPAFRALVRGAADHLEGASPEAKRDPAWHEAALEVALVDDTGPQAFDALFDRATEAHPEYVTLYKVAATYYSPRWHGSSNALYALMDRLVREDRSGLREILYVHMHRAGRPDRMSRDEWSRLQSGLERLLETEPTASNTTLYASLACKHFDMATFERLRPRLGDAPVESAWDKEAPGLAQCVEMARFERQSAADRAEAERAMQQDFGPRLQQRGPLIALAGLKIGFDEEGVLDVVGVPARRDVDGSRARFEYPEMAVTLHGGRVTSIATSTSGHCSMRGDVCVGTPYAEALQAWGAPTAPSDGRVARYAILGVPCAMELVLEDDRVAEMRVACEAQVLDKMPLQ